nr:hypothetical protein [uncultured Rhodopila sp.]
MSKVESDPADNFPSDLDVNVYLDFRKANPALSRQCVNGSATCSHSRVGLAVGDLYREVAFIPLEIYKGDTQDAAAGPENLVFRQVVPFGQFGVSRTLPLSAPLFGKTNWSLTFADNGEITDASFGSAAIGVGATSLLSGAATAASSVEAENLKAASLGSSETQRLIIENTNLQAAVNNANLKQQYQALQAKGLLP